LNFCFEKTKNKFRTSVGLRCKDGVVLGIEKLIHSKMLVRGSNKRLATVDHHIGIVRFIILFIYEEQKDLFSLTF